MSYYSQQQQSQHGGSDWGAGAIGYDGHTGSSSSTNSIPSYSRQSSTAKRRSVFSHRQPVISARTITRNYAYDNGNTTIHHHQRYGGSDWGTGDIGYDGHVSEDVTTSAASTAYTTTSHATNEGSSPPSSRRRRYYHHQPDDAATKMAQRYARTMHDGSEWGSEDVGYDGHSAGIPAS